MRFKPKGERRVAYAALRYLGMGYHSAVRIRDWRVSKMRIAICNIEVWKR